MGTLARNHAGEDPVLSWATSRECSLPRSLLVKVKMSTLGGWVVVFGVVCVVVWVVVCMVVGLVVYMVVWVVVCMVLWVVVCMVLWVVVCMVL